MMIEEWRVIDSHPRWSVSSKGRVKNNRRGNVLKPFPDRHGYLRLSLGNDDNIYVHKLVANAFLEPPESDDLVINHKDSNRQNNNVENLEWCTMSYNIWHGYSKGHIDVRKASLRAAELNRRKVKIVEENIVFNSIKECSEYLNVTPSRINRVLRGERKHIHGYSIEYVS